MANDKEVAVRQLLNLCAENNISIPPDLKEKIINGDRGERDDKRDVNESTGSLGSHGNARTPIGSFLSDSYTIAQSHRKNFDDSDVMKELKAVFNSLGIENFQSWEVRIRRGSYSVTSYQMPEITNTEAPASVECPKDLEEGADYTSHIDDKTKNNLFRTDLPTVINTGFGFKLMQRLMYFRKTGKIVCAGRPCEREILKNLNLRLTSGKLYLVLGLPGSGKSTILKYMANILSESKDKVKGGELTLNGCRPDDPSYVWTNLVAYVDQIDRNHEYLTVKETLQYAFECRRAGTHFARSSPQTETAALQIAELDREDFSVNLVMKALGLTRVKDTFVGDDERVRGVSGGERKRVTVAEMSVLSSPVHCLDEISTGLDAATTYDICKTFGDACRLKNDIRVVSLLQPPPETVALFDELILANQGEVIYAGPLLDVVPHFKSLGYDLPDRTDIADWLLAIPTPEGKKFLREGGTESHLKHAELVKAYEISTYAQEIITAIEAPLDNATGSIPKSPDLTRRYANTWFRSLTLVTKHEFLLWCRDSFRLKARILQGIIMGLVVGTVFFQQADDPTAGVGVLYQSLFFMSLGGLTKVMPQFDCRGVFYKHQDANFFPTSAFVLGRSIAQIPSSLLDACFYGIPVFFLSGMAYNDGATISNFFMFLLITLVSAYTTLLTYTILSAALPDKPTGIGVGVAIILVMVVFSGFTVQPDVIPNYWVWMYWINYFAWLLRALLINQYQSGKFETLTSTGETLGDAYMSAFGFVDSNGVPFQYDWVWWGILYSCGVLVISAFINIVCLNRIRFATGRALQSAETEDGAKTKTPRVTLPFKKANLTFKGIKYTVKSSISKDSIELLKGIDGYFAAGKMTALMGSSGAGKTTLMDVLALRKSSGIVEGEVRVNGHLQDSKSFRRCTGYVEQFDVQSEQLTVRETVEFSAKMRLDRTECDITSETIQSFVDSTLNMLELEPISNFLVGSDSGGGLSFEQRKRLSIAVEVASNPSILFLDEPTSGLDARAASIVMSGLKRIAESGRAVCATIHQPSIAIFNSFDVLLLLKRGGETVYFGDLGKDSCELINYFEKFDCTPRILAGENPATWMLTTIGSGTNASEASKSMDYAKAYSNSDLHTQALLRIEEIVNEASDQNLIKYDSMYATSRVFQIIQVLKRQIQVYWRAPSYNRNRLMLAALIGLLFGSVFANQRVATNEGEMNSRITSLYISSLFIGTIGFSTVLPFFERERNMYYRHKSSLMYDQYSITLAFLVAELPFILLQSMIFSVCFYFPLGFAADASKFFLFYFFVTMNVALWVFVGQMFVALLVDSVTAQGFGSILISMSSLFAGILIPPQNISNVWIWAYWLFPLHYVMEGLVASQFHDDETPITASLDSPYYNFLLSTESCNPCGQTCCGTASNWVEYRFGGFWTYENIKWAAVYLVCVISVTKFVKLYALWQFNYLAK